MLTTAVAVFEADGDRLYAASTTVSSVVRFRAFDRRFAREYVATREPMDKAGAYGVQKLGGGGGGAYRGRLLLGHGSSGRRLALAPGEVGVALRLHGAGTCAGPTVGTMRSPAVLAIDEGTTGVTCLVGRAERPSGGPGLLRIHPELSTRGLGRARFRGDLADRSADGARGPSPPAKDVDVRSVGIANQRETVALWDRESLKPVAPAVVWQDRRTADVCARLRPREARTPFGSGPAFFSIRTFSATKIAWLLNSGDGRLRRRAESGELAAGTMDTWLIARLTDGEVHADRSPPTPRAPCSTG